MKPVNHLRDWLFRQMHANNLVYNTCWEDPRCDRRLLELDGDSEVVMITSAGCNALDYLLDRPARLHCVDMNPRQNALLQLKLATFRAGAYADLLQLFGRGVHEEAEDLYRESLREHLPGYARHYWDKNMNYFNGRGVRRTFYHYSTSGAFAWLANRYLRAQQSLYRRVCELFDADNLDRQAALYYDIERRVLNELTGWIVNRHLVMCLLGVPRSQQLLFRDHYEQGALGFIRECFRRVFTELPLSDNYFWKLYLHGRYEPGCCPSYLQAENFAAIRRRCDKIDTHNATISQFLKTHPGRYSHFVLLDHQDWLAAHDRPALEEEWRLILANSRPGARILLRSAADEVDFFPGFVHDAVTFEQERTRQQHRQDRVGTYASVYLGIVR